MNFDTRPEVLTVAKMTKMSKMQEFQKDLVPQNLVKVVMKSEINQTDLIAIDVCVQGTGT